MEEKVSTLVMALEEVKRQAIAERDQYAKRNQVLRDAIDCALRQLADGNRVLATDTLATALIQEKQA